MQQIAFLLVSVVALGFAGRQFLSISKKILLGRDEEITGDRAQRWRNVLLIAFGQKKMFKRWIPALMHLFIYVAFLFTQIELIEIFIDGITGAHRFFWPILGGFYTFLVSFIEILSVLALLGTIVFLIRRNIIKTSRFHKPEMKGWPFKDANLILYLEVFLIFFIFLMNSADMAAHSNEYGFAISQYLSPIWGDTPKETLYLMERIGWWGHVLVVFAFLNYLPISKHLHIFLAFPNTYYARLKSRGEMDNMPEIMNEVKSMMGLTEATEENFDAEADLPEFGANDVMGLSWKNIMDAYSCTECGRCTSVCPANLTGKKLSPRKIVMDIRDRADEIGQKIASQNKEYAKNADEKLDKNNFDDGKSLFDYISREEIHACTTCNACVEACPVLINPLDIILQTRRYVAMEESGSPASWNAMFQNVETNFAPWKFGAQDRFNWANEMKESN